MAATPNPVEDDFYDTTDDHLFASINVDEDGTSQSNLHVSQSTITDEHDQEQQGENELEEEQIQLVADNPECSSKPSEKSIEMLRKYFGFSKFRPLQYEIIETALRGRDQLCVMSTGYGKSICYQMPALVNDSLTLVVSPLISLMEDQVNALTVAGIESAYLGGNGTFSRDVILKSIEQNRLRILYITPEMYEYNSEFVERIKKFVCLLAVDEAHCISQWGHEFRPGYRFIAKMRASLPGVPVMALTATATEPVRNDICQNLNMKNPKITTTGFDRKNLYIEVKMRTSSLTFEHSVQNDIERLLIDDPKHGPNFGGSTIIYCQSRENVDRITRQLRSIGVKCVGYHAAMNGQAREKAHKDFLTEKANTCVATIAFGMGIDKKDVRKVIHYGSPGSIENYYQEIGRAGRDGFNSQCIIFYSNSDLMMNRSRILKRPVNGYNKPNDYEQHQLDMLRRMEQFLTTTSCRRYLILSYFDNSIKHPDVPQSDCCDNCTRLLQSGNDLTGYGTPAAAIDFGIEAGQIFEVIGQIYRGYSGLNKPVDFIRGNASLLNDKSTLRGCKNPKNHPLFGIGKGRSEMWWKELGKLLRNNGYLVERKETFQQYGCTIKLSDKAERWIEGRTKQLKLIPSVFLENANRESPSTNVKAAKGARVKKPIFDIVTERLLNAGKQREYKDASNYPELAAVSNANIAIYEILPELRKQLEDLRYELALEMDCAANSIYSNTVIENLLKIRPTKESTFENVEGIPQQRQQLLSRRICPMIEKFCNEKKIPRDCSNCTDLELPEMIERLKSELSETERRYYINHVLYKLTLQEVANRLKATTSTVGNHLATAVKRGLPLDLDVLGITTEMIEKVYGKVEENRRDIFRLKPIMELLPADTLDYNQMKIIFSIFEYEYGFVNSEGNENAVANCEEEVASIFKRKVPAWIQTSATVPNSEDNAGPLIKKKCHSIFQ